MRTIREKMARTSARCTSSARAAAKAPRLRGGRRGSLLTIVMVLLVVITLLTAALLRGSLLGIRRLQMSERVAQADLLLQAGRDRGVALWRGAGPEGWAEGPAQWDLSAEEVPGGAQVELRLAEGPAGSAPQLDVTVTYPREGPTPVRREGRFALPARGVDSPPTVPADRPAAPAAPTEAPASESQAK
ncbi:MAG: hypothetical protein ACK5TO_21010 [Planctomycetaceae bacterium]